MRRNTFIVPLAMLLFLALSAAAAVAQEVTPEVAYNRLFTEPIQAEWFSSDILAQISVDDWEEIVAQFAALLGRFERVEQTGPINYNLIFEQGRMESQLALGPDGKIIGIWFNAPELTVGSLDGAVEEFDELPGKVSLLVIKDQAVLAARNEHEPLAVGSAFKLAILAALKDLVAAGVLAWDNVVTLEAGDKSLPTGMLQDWPEGTALTLETLAALMISISDNTATDALLRVVGRELVEQYAPRNVPFLSTREVFALNNPDNAELLAAFRAGDVAEKRALLTQLAEAQLPHPGVFTEPPKAMDVEWHFSTFELANLIFYVHDLPLMSINPGLASPDDWQYVAFKGGAMPGVLNFTTLLVGETGATYIVSATWNNPEGPVEEVKFASLYKGLLQAIRELEAQ